MARKIKKNREKEQRAVKVMEKGKKETGGIEQTDLQKQETRGDGAQRERGKRGLHLLLSDIATIGISQPMAGAADMPMHI